MKKIRINIFLTALIVSLCANSVFARGVPFPAEDGGNGKITVTLKNQDDETVAGGKLSLFKVRNVTWDNEKFYYEKAEEFAEFTGTDDAGHFSDYLRNLDTDSDLAFNAEFAKALSNFITTNELLPLDTQQVSSEGVAIFSDVKNGLYVIVQTESSPKYLAMAPFIMSVPQYNITDDLYYYEIDARPKTGVLTPAPTPTPPEVPNTGLPWVPAICMAAAGMVLFITGYIKHKKYQK